MDFGVALASNLDAWKTVKRAEELGFSHAWFYDSQMLAPDIFVAMALAADRTSTIKLAMGVLVPTNRIAPAAANGLASLNKLAPGRIVFGVGTGFTARNTMGLPPMRLSDLREYLRVVKGLLGGETVEWECEGARHKIRFLNPEAGLINIKDKIPLHLSAFAPKARKMTAEIADGWITFTPTVPRAISEAGELAKACKEVGRAPETLYRTAFALGCVLGQGESAGSARAKAQAGPMSVVYLHGLVEATLGFGVPPEVATIIEAYRKQHATYQPSDAKYLQMHKMHLIGVRPEEEKFLSPELIKATTFTATSLELRDRIRALRDGGYNQFVVQLVPGHEAALEDWAAVFDSV
ncbi:MAG: LLM class flavin-dependent oxidoreductase [Candidatus Binatus sp.]|uniref:LLM class flavin-dependent oxidoreductase n=1 Tax=Candidatus Binatus sp. TaxID=2811406 RepID=UPI002721D527|nr:LLM class flavin-dependent oxidoreductase [Candidatus Binatus sp.]MDO8433210.1 LLM class flavin-dependent oxidoreductase [Candidatus Binatus sp.]